MTSTNDERVQKVADVVEGVLQDIASENDSPFVMAPAIAKFLVAVQQMVMRKSNERLMALLRRKDQ